MTHPRIDDLADAAEGLLDPDRASRVAGHLAGCAECQQQAGRLAAVSAALAAEPAPTMPAAVAARLDGVLAAEAERRARFPVEHPTPGRAPAPERGAGGWRPASLGAFHPPTTPRWWHRLLPVGAAVVAAAVVGFAGYLASSAAGTNEPPTVALGASAGDLPAAARSVAARDDLGAHRFSRAWFCARQVTDGRITGLAETRWEGASALLVYTRDDGGTRVGVVTGCAADRPVLTASVPLNR